MKYHYALIPAILGVSIVLVQPQIAVGLSRNQVDEIAEKITVLIDSQEPGSGVIIKKEGKKEGNIYTVLTAYHVVKNPNFKYEIVTPNGQRYSVKYNTVKTLAKDIDLAVLQFTSNQDYQVAKIGNSEQAQRRTTAYVAGFPRPTGAIKRPIYDLRDGQISANASQALSDGGYALVYDNDTLPGMSGGPVMNDKGEVIAIHGRGDTITIATSEVNTRVAVVKSGRNLGIPINTFVRLSARVGVDVGIRLPETPIITTPKADDFFAQGVDKQNKEDLRGAILAYTQAIRLNPNYSEAHNNRGIVRSSLGDKKGAIEDYNQALRINPNYANAYNNRGNDRDDLGDKKGAIEDYNQALRINPNYANAYYNRGVARSDLGDKNGAIEDYTQALRINPNYSYAYNNRGNARSNLGDKKGAIEDYNQALRINPNNANAYYNRGLAQRDLGDTQSAIANFQKAADLYQQQGKTDDYQDALNQIRKLSN